MSIINLTPSQLRKAAQLKEQIAKLQGELNQLVGAPAAKTIVSKPVKKHKMSAAGKARIVAAQKARWAKIKAGQPATKPAALVKKAKRTMSAAAKAKISAAAKARWAKVKAAKK